MEIDKPIVVRQCEALRAWLTRTGTTQQGLARLLDLSESQVSLYMNGKRSLSMQKVLKLALLTDIPMEKLWKDSTTERLLKLLGHRMDSRHAKSRKARNVA